jgi:hypothetical protein
LQLFEGLFLVDVGDYTRCVDHSWAQEPSVEVVTAVVVVSNLLLICKKRKGLEKVLKCG